MSPSPTNSDPPSSPGSSDNPQVSRARKILAASHGWQTLLAALVAGAVAIVVAILPDGGDGRRSDTGTTDNTRSPAVTSLSRVHINSITHVQAPSKVIVTLAGDYEVPEDGWTVYAFGQQQKTEKNEAGPASWKVQRATVDARKQTWVAKFTVDETPVTLRWSAGLVYEGHEGDGGGEPPSEECDPGMDCAQPLLDILESEGPESLLVTDPAPTKTTTIPAPS
ncbi:hypothetical protein [Streptomyces sp. NPDC059861]|uniref:hypothetical protein n=1 Tax=Streptomyces sp. NPDC059861 TaxID=3346974 RepID=UPI00364F4494